MDKFTKIAADLGFPHLLEGSRIFITGGTGFIGSAMLRTYLSLHDKLGWDAEIVVLSRDPDAHPEWAQHKNVHFAKGGLLDFPFLPGEFSHVIHCAAPTDTAFFRSHPQETYTQIVDGTKRVLEFAVKARASRFLYLSSGAIYGPRFAPPSNPVKIAETEDKIIQETSSWTPYARGKIAAEKLCREFSSSMATMMARGFALSGEGLPLDKTYALGNFVRDTVKGGPIVVGGDGTPYRSYLDSHDLSLWLWAMLAKGKGGEAYNVGSELPYTIRELANYVSGLGGSSVQIEPPPQPHPAQVNCYLPSTEKARKQLGLAEWTSLEESVKTMLALARRAYQ